MIPIMPKHPNCSSKSSKRLRASHSGGYRQSKNLPAKMGHCDGDAGLTVVPVSATYAPNLAHKDAAREGTPRGSGRVRCLRAGPYTPFSGGFGHQPAGTMTGARGARWTRTRPGRVQKTRLNCARSAPPGWGERYRPDAPAGLRKPWPEAAPLGDDNSLRQEPWWDADRRAPLRASRVGARGSEGGAASKDAAIVPASVGVPLP